MTGSVVSDDNNVSPESHAPTSLLSDPKSIGLSSPTFTASYSTFPVVGLNVKLDAIRFAGVPKSPLIPVIEPVPSS